jgi:hypothetical protein
MNNVTPATRLLEKRRQMFEVQEALEAQKQDFARKVRQRSQWRKAARLACWHMAVWLPGARLPGGVQLAPRRPSPCTHI